MKIAFLYSEMETLGIQYISSVLKLKGHETELFFDPVLFMDTVTRNRFLGDRFDYGKKLIANLEKYEPDLIAFSVMSVNYEWACSLAERIKKRLNVPVVFGGIHPTALPQEVLSNSFVDLVVCGEGEQAMLELVECGINRETFSRIKNLCYREGTKIVCNPLRDLEKDLDKLPFPDKNLFYNIMPYLKENYTLITSRGCPHHCTYCCNGYLNKLYKGKYLRRRSPGNVIAELLWAKKKFGIKYVFFDDSTFSYDLAWLRAFAGEYCSKIGLPCFCWVYPSDVTPELISLLNAINCKAVEMGVESLDGKVRKEIFKRHYDNVSIENAIKLFNKSKIFCVVDNIKGCSGDLEEELRGMVRFYNRNRPQKIYIFEHRLFPKTELSECWVREQKGQEPRILPFTIATQATTAVVRQLELLAVLIYFFPKSWIEVILRKRIYRFFPIVAAYNILEILPYFLNFFKFKRNRYRYPIRGTRQRYLHFFARDPLYFWGRLIRSWV